MKFGHGWIKLAVLGKSRCVVASTQVAGVPEAKRVRGDIEKITTASRGWDIAL
jgi:hypothetical protein